MSDPTGQEPTAPVPPDKRPLFRAALALAKRTAKDFAEELGVSENHLYLVVCGKRDSKRLETAVDDFIAKHLAERAHV